MNTRPIRNTISSAYFVLFAALLTGCPKVTVTITAPGIGVLQVEVDPGECTEHADGSATCTVCPVGEESSGGAGVSQQMSSDSEDECFEHTFSPEEVRKFKARYGLAVDSQPRGDARAAYVEITQ